MGEAAAECLDEDEVLAFVGGELASKRRREVLSHVDGCDSCRRLAAEVARDGAEGSEDPGESAFEPGNLVDGRFRLGEALGRGAMGTVFRARDEKLGVDLALKAIRRTKGDAKGLAREVNAGRKISHPNVCRLYDAGGAADFDYITMELVEGETLALVLARQEMALDRALGVLDMVAAGLAAAHEEGIVHRDLKPANVMLESATSRAVLTDFGFAADLDAKQSRRLVGTPAYWSPEQARGEAAAPSSDVYSFGVLAYRLLAQRDFALNDRDALDHVPRRLRRVVARCLALRPTDRYANATEAREAFAAATKTRSSRTWALVAVALLGLVSIGVARRASGPAAGPERISEAPPSPSAPSSAVPTPAAAVSLGSTAPAVAPSPSISPASSISAVATATPGLPVHPPSMPSPSPRLSRPAAPAASSPAPSPAAAASKPTDGDILFYK